MATENQVETTPSGTEATSGQVADKQDEQKPQDGQQEQQPATGEQQPQGQEQQKPSDGRLPDDHPLVKAYAASQQSIKDLKAAQTTKVQELEGKLAEATKAQEQAESIKARHERLEAFLLAAGGPMAKALDSKSFTTRLFETDDKVADIVTDWLRDNPSATSQALRSSSTDPGKKQSINDAIRAAAR